MAGANGKAIVDLNGQQFATVNTSSADSTLQTPPSELEISVIVPTRNEESHVGKCLDSLLAQDFDGGFEIIVVDGMSDDRTREIVSEYVVRDARVHLVSNPQRVTPVALNLGVRKARGKIVLRVDGHWHVPRTFLSRIDALLKRHSVDCFGGRIVRHVKTRTGRAIEAARSSLLGGRLAMRNYSSAEEEIVHEPNVAYVWRKHVFEKVGLFDERFLKNQDNEFNFRTLEAGLQTLFSSRVVFHYEAPDTYQRLFRQMLGYSKYAPMMIMKHKRLLNRRLALPLLGFVIWMVLLGMSIVGTKVPLVVPVGLLGSYVAVTTLAAVHTSMLSRNVRAFHLIFLAYFTIHVAVAVGYLIGVVKLFNPYLSISLWRRSNIFPGGESPI